MWRVARPSEYLVRTGLFINSPMGMSVSRKALLLPGQVLQRVVMKPRNLHFTLKCLSQQYLPFKMPVTYTVTPYDPAGTGFTERFRTTNANGTIEEEQEEISADILFKR